LIHVSELTDRRITHPKEVVSEGEEYDLRIIRIDTDKRRMGLSLKQALPPSAESEIDWQIAPSDANDMEVESDASPEANLAPEVEPAEQEAEAVS
jgi:small subunit ribosomal protein S1